MREVALALILQEGRVFLQRRDPAASILPGLWECPGGGLEAGETPAQALVRELQEELGWRPETWRALPALRHAYPYGELRFWPFLCPGPRRLGCGLAWGWFLPLEALALPLPEATRRLLSREWPPEAAPVRAAARMKKA